MRLGSAHIYHPQAARMFLTGVWRENVVKMKPSNHKIAAAINMLGINLFLRVC